MQTPGKHDLPIDELLKSTVTALGDALDVDTADLDERLSRDYGARYTGLPEAEREKVLRSVDRAYRLLADSVRARFARDLDAVTPIVRFVS